MGDEINKGNEIGGRRRKKRALQFIIYYPPLFISVANWEFLSYLGTILGTVANHRFFF